MKNLMIRLWKEEEGQDLDRVRACCSFLLSLAAIGDPGHVGQRDQLGVQSGRSKPHHVNWALFSERY